MRALILTVIALVLAVLGALFGPAAISAMDDPETPATGDLTYRHGTFVLRLTDQPCPFEEIDAELGSSGIPPAKAYRTLQPDGRWSMPGCWAKDMSGDVLTRDTAGADGFVPMDWFKR